MKALHILKIVLKDTIMSSEKEYINEAIKELEELETKDRLAELEKVILDYYLAKGYRIGVGGWGYSLHVPVH